MIDYRRERVRERGAEVEHQNGRRWRQQRRE